MYRLLKTDGRAKRGELQTVHGTIQTPVFMNVGTVAAIKGAVSTMDLKEIGTQVELSSQSHVSQTSQKGTVSTEMGYELGQTDSDRFRWDSGVSLAGLRKIKKRRPSKSFIDGRKIFMGPEEMCRFSQLSSSAMAFDEYLHKTKGRTIMWKREVCCPYNALVGTL